MKKFLNLFYTFPFKAFLIILIAILSLEVGTEYLNMFDLYYEDAEGLINVLYQGKNFNYIESNFLYSEIEKTIEAVTKYSLKYDDDRKELAMANDSDFKETADYLNSLKGVNYAVLNHNTKQYISNLKEIDKKKADFNVNSFFNEKNTLIVQNSKNPHYVNGYLSEFVDKVNSLSKLYPCNFDIYISFPDNFEFRFTENEYEKRHVQIYEQVFEIFISILILIGIQVVVYTIIVIISGQHEPKGKCYYSMSDKIPTDAKMLLYLVDIISMFALMETSIFMRLLPHSFEGSTFHLSPEFYDARTKIALMIIALTFVSIITTIKRHVKNGTLIKSTYIYKAIKNFRSANPIENE